MKISTEYTFDMTDEEEGLVVTEYSEIGYDEMSLHRSQSENGFHVRITLEQAQALASELADAIAKLEAFRNRFESKQSTAMPGW